MLFFFFFQAEDGIRDRSPSRGLGDVYKRQEYGGFQLIDAHLTFTELAEAWLQSVKCGLKESTCAHYQYTLYKYVLPILGTVPISRLEENILEQALQKIIAPPDGQHKELGFSSARECLSMVRRICKYAVHLRLIRPMELSCLLYTSDAADEEDSVDLGGRRIIKKKKNVHMSLIHISEQTYQ